MIHRIQRKNHAHRQGCVRHIGAVGLACAVVSGVSDAAVWHFNWAFYTGPGVGGTVTYSYTSVPYAYAFQMYGGNLGIGGDTYNLMAVCEDLTLTVEGVYSSTDIGVYDYAYYSINGVPVEIASNESQGPFNFTIAVKKGDEVRFGVHTVDGLYGAGSLSINQLGVACHRGYEDFQWHAEDDGPMSASITLPPPTLGVVGGNGGAAERAYAWATVSCPTWFSFAGQYESLDISEFDVAFHYRYIGGGPLFVPIATNATQGPVSGSFYHPGGQIQKFDGKFGFGVDSTDGQFFPGILTLPDFDAAQSPASAGNLNFNVATNGTGGTGIYKDGNLNITGGNSDVPGSTEFYATAAQGYRVQAQVEYWSTDTGCYDSVYYVINGVSTTIACNSQQGVHQVEFSVPIGGTFGFGVWTADGAAGAGQAAIKRFRAFPTNNAPPAVCSPDCDQNGTLTIDDFICFQTLFAIGDPAADCDESGDLTIDDFICFQTLFAIGC